MLPHLQAPLLLFLIQVYFGSTVLLVIVFYTHTTFKKTTQKQNITLLSISYGLITILRTCYDITLLSISYELITILHTCYEFSLNRPDPNFKTYIACTFSSGLQINSLKAETEVKRSCFYPRMIVSTFARLELGAFCPTRVTDMEYLW